MDVRTQAKKAEQFRKLHHGPRLLLLPNAWDVASAGILEECGHPAIATTSAGIAYSFGYPDGQRISRGEMLEVVGRIARAVRIPVTADLEAGYGTTVKEMAETVKAAIEAGAIGMNLEDVTGDDESSQVAIPLQAEKIRVIRETAASLGVPLRSSSGRSSVCAPIATQERIVCLRPGSTTGTPSPSWLRPWKPRSTFWQIQRVRRLPSWKKSAWLG